MTKRLRAALLGAVFVGALGLTACDPSAQADTPSAAQDAITQAFGPIADQAMGVAQCESGLDPNAVSRGGGNWGLFQINTVHRGSFESVTGQPWDNVLDPYANSQFAAWLYNQSGGWSPWACRWAA
jgi:soluble lytic murein transglycosylase-like protein